MSKQPSRLRQPADSVAEQAKKESPQPIPTKPTFNSLLSLGILILAIVAVVCALYVGKEVFLPLAFALVLKLYFNPSSIFCAVECTFRQQWALSSLLSECSER
jgi:hypothetical protein